jgi:hypothetical protein
MQGNISAALLTALLFLCPLTVSAGFEYEEIIEGYYLVSFERSTWTKGGVLDTQERVDGKLIKKTHKLCLKEKYSFIRFPLLQEVARNKALRTAWLEKSEELADESGWEKWVENHFSSETHSARKIVFFTRTPGDGLENCRK